MKFFTAVVFVCASNSLVAQWQPINSSGTDTGNIYHMSGRVGIGTTSPSSLLHLVGQGGSWTTSAWNKAIEIPNVSVLKWAANSNGWRFGIGQSDAGLYYTRNNADDNSTGPNYDMFISNGGYAGIGTTSPSQRLHVNGAVRIDGASGGVVGSGGGSRIELSTGGTTSIEENWGINLIGNDGSPVKVRNAALLVGYTSTTAGWGTGGNLLVQGNAGIGTTTPGAKLDVGAFISGGTLGTVFGRLSEGNSAGAGTFLGVRGYDTQPTNAKSFAIEHSFYGNVNSSINFSRGGGTTGGFITFNTDVNTEQVRITNTGYVGIGTPSPDAKLAVAGQVHAQEVKVSITVPGPDYVFEKDYHLSSLEYIKTYIDENKHLPEVPSAKEMEKNGIQIGEMNMLLLKKIEELTLYVIELKKEVSELKENQNN